MDKIIYWFKSGNQGVVVKWRCFLV